MLVLFSYIFDWVLVVALAAAGGVLTYISGFHRPFSLTDTAIVFPDKTDIISLPVLVLLALVFPAVAIAITSLVLHARPSASASLRERFRSCLWEVHSSLLGLCLSLAGTLFFTAGLKDLIGKPRPLTLTRCMPDLTRLPSAIVGGLGDSITSEASFLVSSAICQQSDRRKLDDAFAAFPSGHSSFASAGLVFLTLWLCANFGIPIPYLERKAFKSRTPLRPRSAPPVWQLIFALTPLGLALFICASRYADFHHAGIDIFSGAVLGTLVALLIFRLYLRPTREQGRSLSWAPRSRETAFFAVGDKSLSEAHRNESQSPIILSELGQNRPGAGPTTYRSR